MGWFSRNQFLRLPRQFSFEISYNNTSKNTWISWLLKMGWVVWKLLLQLLICLDHFQWEKLLYHWVVCSSGTGQKVKNSFNCFLEDWTPLVFLGIAAHTVLNNMPSLPQPRGYCTLNRLQYRRFTYNLHFCKVEAFPTISNCLLIWGFDKYFPGCFSW